MNAAFQFTPQATEDLDAIWWFIAEDNRDAADRVEHNAAAGAILDRHEFPNYVIVYRSETIPLQMVAVLHGEAVPT